MQKKSKRIIKMGLTMLSAAAPISLAVSCNSAQDDINNIVLVMRASDFDVWKPIITQYNKYTGNNVELRVSNSQESEYATWNSAGGLPDILLADNNTVSASINKGWFSSINVKEFKETKDISNSGLKLDLSNPKNYNPTLFNAVSSKNKETVLSIPYSFTNEAVYINQRLIDSSKNIYAMVPSDDGLSFNKVDTGLKGTKKNISNFIMNSATKNSTGLPKGKTLEGWEDIGPLAFQQRLSSVGLSLADPKNAYYSTKNNSKLGSSGTIGGLVEDISFGMESISSIAGAYDSKIKKIDDNKLMESLPRPSKKDISNKNSTIFKKYKEIMKKLYRGSYGYFDKWTNGASVSPDILGESGKAEVFTKAFGNKGEQAAILYGPKWFDAGYFQSNWVTNVTQNSPGDKIYNLYNDVWTLPVPYTTIGYDSLAISSKLKNNSKKRTKVLEFIKFALSFDASKKVFNAKNIAGKKSTTTNTMAVDYLKQELNNKIYYQKGEGKFKETNYTKEEIKDLNKKKIEFDKSFIENGYQWDSSKQTIDKSKGSESYNGISGGVTNASTKQKYKTFSSKIKEIMGKNLRIFYSKNPQKPTRKTLDEMTSIFMKAVKEVYGMFDLEDI